VKRYESQQNQVEQFLRLIAMNFNPQGARAMANPMFAARGMMMGRGGGPQQFPGMGRGGARGGGFPMQRNMGQRGNNNRPFRGGMPIGGPP